jgi:hypothetical protein
MAPNNQPNYCSMQTKKIRKRVYAGTGFSMTQTTCAGLVRTRTHDHSVAELIHTVRAMACAPLLARQRAVIGHAWGPRLGWTRMGSGSEARLSWSRVGRAVAGGTCTRDAPAACAG